jgi:hypothetical protein
MDKSKLDELRDYYDTTSQADALAQATRDDRTVEPDEVMVSTSIRLPGSLMRRVREHAAAAGVPATTLMRQWVLDRLDTDASDTVVSVTDLEQFIAERARRVA